MAMALAGCALLASAQPHPLQKARSQPAVEDRAADELKAAELLLEKQQYAEAEEKFQALVRLQSQNPQAIV